jgi:hypothetical protein
MVEAKWPLVISWAMNKKTMGKACSGGEQRRREEEARDTIPGVFCNAQTSPSWRACRGFRV